MKAWLSGYRQPRSFEACTRRAQALDPAKRSLLAYSFTDTSECQYQRTEDSMAKANRGKNLKNERPNGARGRCPVTGKTGVKLLYEYEMDGQKVMISKAAKATLSNQKRRQAREERKKESGEEG
jgi:hypothetical protein